MEKTKEISIVEELEEIKANALSQKKKATKRTKKTQK